MISQQQVNRVGIRKAKPSDAKAVSEIANMYRFDKRVYKEKGFLTFILTEDEYKERIKISDFFYVAEVGEMVVGYFYSYDDSTLEKVHKDKVFYKNPNVADFVLAQKRPFILGIQIAIHMDFSYQGIGKQMYERFLEDIMEDGISEMYVNIVHDPYKNFVSINFVKGLGFDFLEEVKDNEDRTWGIYYVGSEEY